MSALDRTVVLTWEERSVARFALRAQEADADKRAEWSSSSLTRDSWLELADRCRALIALIEGTS